MTAEELRVWLIYTPESGVFTWRKSPNRRIRVGAVAGSPHDHAVLIRLHGKMYKAHRLAWLYQTGNWPELLVDHINGNGLDNQWCNLRAATYSDNMENQRAAHIGSSTGKLGTHYCNTRHLYIARIRVKGKHKHLGSFKTSDEAHAAYVAAKREYHAFNTL